MTDLQILSGSSINTYLRCGKQWEYAYVYELKRPPSIRQVVGLAAHSAVELNYAQKIQTHQDLSSDEVETMFSDAFDALVRDVRSEEESEQPGEAKDSGVATIKEYQKTVASKIQPVMVEEEVQFKINGQPYGGTLDLVDDQGRIRDLKNTKRRPQGSSDYLLNMTGYALGYRHVTGETETDVVLDYMVRTKTPYYWPVASEGPVSNKAIATFATIVAEVARAISTGVFLPTGLQSHACGWCGYADICEAYQNNK